VPGAGNPQAYNRYSYVLNNPIRYNDPTGHVCSDPDDPTPSCDGSGGPPPNQTPLPDGPVDIPGGPLDPGQEQDDPTPTPKPSGGGHPLLSLSNDITQNCQSNPYCFYANQTDIFNQANTLYWASLGFGAAAVLIGVVGAALMIASIPVAPLPVAWGTFAIGAVLVGVGIWLGAEAVASGITSSNLATVGMSMNSNDVVQIEVQSNTYHIEGTTYNYNPSLPLTSLLMQSWADNLTK